MRLRTVLSALLFALAVTAAHAQTNKPDQAAAPAERAKPATPAPAAQTAARETPPEAKALQDATRINDGVKKIEALEKFKKDFPNSNSVITADFAILSTLAQKMSGQKPRIKAVAKLIYDGGKDKKEKGSRAGQIADTLVTDNVLLKDAEKYAKISLAALNQAEYIADQKAQAAKRVATATGRGGRGGTPPTEADLIKRFQESRAVRLATLGRVELKLGKTAAAQTLLDESYAVNANQPAVTAALGEIAAKQGNDAKAMDYLVTARLSGRSPASTNLALVTVYSKTHNGSAAGLDALLDAEYHKRFPNPVKVETYKPTEQRSDRGVLAEVFTGSGCPPCVGADLAFEAAMERYARKDLTVVMYHQHVPQPDPMTNPDTQARSKYYAVTGVPTYAVDGATLKGNGAGREGTKGIFDKVDSAIAEDLETAAEARLTVHATANGNTVHVSAAVDDVKSEAKDLKVHVLLLEKELTYSGENGIRFHPMVVRAMGGQDDDGFALTAGATSFDQAWDLDQVSAGLKKHLDEYEATGHRGNAFKFSEKKYQIDRANLAVAVFVQDVKTRHILQTVYVDLNPASPHISTEANASR